MLQRQKALRPTGNSSPASALLKGPASKRPALRRKLVVVGDGATGKTCLLTVFALGRLPRYYVPTTFEQQEGSVVVDGVRVVLALWDTAGQEEYARLRPLAYPGTDVVLVCCAVDLPDSLENAEQVWVPEVLRHCPRGVQVMLVVTKTDLRGDEHTRANLAVTDQAPVAAAEAARMGEALGVAAVMECLARSGAGVGEVFETAARLAVGAGKRRARKGGGRCMLL